MTGKYLIMKTSTRVITILHLCLAFTAIFWVCGLPFMGELFRYKSQILLYENIIDDSTRFQQIPSFQQNSILENYHSLQKRYSSPFFIKLRKAFLILLVELPPFELAWIIFSIIISIMLLLRKEGANNVIWLLPLIAALYGIDNYVYGKPRELASERALFPSEEIIIKDYLGEPLNPSIGEQQMQLLRGWHIYLVKEWNKQTPSEDPILFEEQIKTGKYAFNLARLEKLKSSDIRDQSIQLHQRKPVPLLYCYFFWNLIFALLVALQRLSQRNFCVSGDSNK